MNNSYTPIIESPQNPRIKAALKLRKASARKREQQTIVEGYREILRAHESGWRFNVLYYCPELYLNKNEAKLIEAIKKNGTDVFQCSFAAFKKMSYRDTPDGLIALSPLVEKTLNDLHLRDNPLILIAEDLEKPGNLGTILRSAEAAGADAVITCNPKTDLSNPNVIRASIGTLFYIPIATATTEDTLNWLETHNIQTVAALPAAKTCYTSIEMKKGTAIVVGSEDNGLSSVWEQKATHQAFIPMAGRNDSLNVSTAAAIILYEAVRQRAR